MAFHWCLPSLRQHLLLLLIAEFLSVYYGKEVGLACNKGPRPDLNWGIFVTCILGRLVTQSHQDLNFILDFVFLFFVCFLYSGLFDAGTYKSESQQDLPDTVSAIFSVYSLTKHNHFILNVIFSRFL